MSSLPSGPTWHKTNQVDAGICVELQTELNCLRVGVLTMLGLLIGLSKMESVAVS